MIKRRTVQMYREFLCPACHKTFVVQTTTVIGQREFPCSCGALAVRRGRVPQWEREEIAEADGKTKQ